MEGGQIRRVGILVHVPFPRLSVGKRALGDNLSTRQRGLHDNSVCNESIRRDGWRDDQGMMLAIEVPWNETTWAEEIAKGDIPVGTVFNKGPSNKSSWH